MTGLALISFERGSYAAHGQFRQVWARGDGCTVACLRAAGVVEGSGAFAVGHVVITSWWLFSSRLYMKAGFLKSFSVEFLRYACTFS